MATEISVSLTLTGRDFDPDDITSSIGIKPTSKWRQGDRILESIVTREHDGWSLSTPNKESDDLGQEVRRLFNMLGPYAGSIREACKRHRLDLEIACVIYSAADVPAMHLESDLIKLIAEMDGDVDIDLYLLPPADGAS